MINGFDPPGAHDGIEDTAGGFDDGDCLGTVGENTAIGCRFGWLLISFVGVDAG